MTPQNLRIVSMPVNQILTSYNYYIYIYGSQLICIFEWWREMRIKNCETPSLKQRDGQSLRRVKAKPFLFLFNTKFTYKQLFLIFPL